jgi:hypothetical protein
MDVSIEKIVATYIKIRDAKEANYQDYKNKDQDFEAQMDTLRYKLLEVSKETGVTSFATPFGTAYRTVKQRYWTNNWEQFYQFIQQHNVIGLLEKRIHQTNMKEFLEGNPDAHPPGLNVDSEYDFSVKRK